MTFLALALVILGQAPGPASNPVYREVVDEGLVVEGVTVKLAPPALREGMTEAEVRAALKSVVDVPFDEFLRDSVNAPFQLKVRDVSYPSGVIRVVDLRFVVHADLDEINLDDLAGQADGGGKEVSQEVGNMSFSVRTLADSERQAHGKAIGGGLDRFLFTRGVLLDRVEVATVNHIVASKAGGELIIASRTDPAFGKDEVPGNRWVPLAGQGDARKATGEPRPYAGSMGYSRVVRISEKPPSLLVESHLAYAEPKGWFNGASVLRSKLGLVAQDQIRRLRREVASRRKKDGAGRSEKP